MEFTYSPNFGFGVNQQLMDIIREAAKRSQYDIIFNSGKNARKAGTKWHPSGTAVDISLKDPESGKILPNYQNAKYFKPYEEFAQIARTVQQEKYPNLSNKFRWGGYFSGGKGKYGALDLMHFDVGGPSMGGGSWKGGLTPQQRKIWPGISSAGMTTSADPGAGLSARPPQQEIGAGLSSPPVPQAGPPAEQPDLLQRTLDKIFKDEQGGGEGTNLMSRIGEALGGLSGGRQAPAEAPDLPNPPSTAAPNPVPVPMPFDPQSQQPTETPPAGGDDPGTQDMSESSTLAALASQITPEQLDMFRRMGLV